MTFFDHIPEIKYRYYKPDQKVLGKRMEDHLRIGVCFWHTFCWPGVDMFGNPTFQRPWDTPEKKIEAGFEFIKKMGLKFFTFHNYDIAPPGVSFPKMIDLIEHQMEKTKIELLWGTTNLTAYPCYMSGAATNPDPNVFAYAINQVKETLDATHRLKGHNFVFWGGREGYETLLNTNMRQELDQLARFFSMLVDYKHKIGFKGLFLIEPKPHEPTKHQYDFDVAAVFAFLQKYGLEKEFKMNIECNHATLARHTFEHEVSYAFANDLFGSIDANQGDPLLGWDTDQFPSDVLTYTQVIYLMLQHGGFTSGGFNLDAKVRRQSIDLEDLVYGHALSVDALAKALLQAAELFEKKEISTFVKERYANWQTDLGKKILSGEATVESLSSYVKEKKIDPKPISGRQEWLEYQLLS